MRRDNVGGCRGRQLALIVLLALVPACGPEGDAIDPPVVAAPFPLLGSASDFYVDEDNPAAVWARSAPPGPEADVIRDQIASRPAAQVVRAPGQVKQTVARAAGTNTMPILLVDPKQAEACGTGHRAWLDGIAAAIGEAPALVVVRVDEGCSTAAAKILGALARTIVLLDVSDSSSAAVASEKIASAGRDVDGFAVNVRGYADETTANANASAIRHHLLAATGRNDYLMVADSSRGGAPTSGDCNPADARVGQNQVLRPERDKLHLLWLTTPGVSDGPCGEAPASRAGEFVPALAHALAKRP
ncbi:glycoside hydrolase family 6 protein [Amycolatopsis sp. lyj-108]|uniref:glycoside hydrolase family 6 protein n=1 Tax=Amycolatopsis sp. lyj-108 TaxID=2789286 RepID=UPI003979F434